jgi:hypothetical protein
LENSYIFAYHLFTIKIMQKHLMPFYNSVNPNNMRKRIVFALFALMVLSLSFSGCKSKELCPAYGDSTPVQVEENLS